MVARTSRVWAYLLDSDSDARQRVREYARDRFAKLPNVTFSEDFCVDSLDWMDDRLFERPAGRFLSLNLLPGDHVIFDSYRACRSGKDLAGLLRHCRERCLTFHILDLNLDSSSADGTQLAKVIGAMAELDRQRRRYVARQSARPRVPLGWRYVGRGKRRPIPCEQERADCMEIVRLHDQEGFSFDQIWLRWDRTGKQSKYGRRWSEGRIKNGYRAATRGFAHPLSIVG